METVKDSYMRWPEKRCGDVEEGMSEVVLLFFFFNDTATTEIYTLSLHDALPIFLFRNGWFQCFSV